MLIKGGPLALASPLTPAEMDSLASFSSSRDARVLNDQHLNNAQRAVLCARKDASKELAQGEFRSLWANPLNFIESEAGDRAGGDSPKGTCGTPPPRIGPQGHRHGIIPQFGRAMADRSLQCRSHLLGSRRKKKSKAQFSFPANMASASSSQTTRHGTIQVVAGSSNGTEKTASTATLRYCSSSPVPARETCKRISWSSPVQARNAPA